MIRLFQFPGMHGLSSMSPFCIKAEAYLRMVALPYENKFIMNPSRAPKGKLPFILDGDQAVGDSHLIIKYLKSKYGDPLDSKLSDSEKAIALSFQKLIEEDLYWVMLYARWGDEKGYFYVEKFIGSKIPRFLRPFIMRKIKNKLLQQCKGHGILRHSQDEIYARGIENITAVRDFLGNKKFFMGDEPTSIDASVFGFLETFRQAPQENIVKEFVLKNQNLVEYCDGFKSRFF